MTKLLNVDYAGINSAYWMYYGVVSSFASAFLLAKGYTNSDIGVILAIGSIAAVILQPLTADYADRTKRFSIMDIAQTIVAVLMAGEAILFFLDKKSLIMSVIFVSLVTWVAVIQPLFNALSFRLQCSGVHINFGIARGMGSLAYSIICIILGTLVERLGVSILPLTGEIILIGMMFFLILTKLHYKKACNLNGKTHAMGIDIKNTPHVEESNINLIQFIKRNKIFILVNVGVFGIYFSNATLMNFELQIVTNVGGTSEDMGRIFALMAALEVPTLFLYDKIKSHFSSVTLLKVASAAFAMRIGIYFMAGSVSTLYIVQIMQIFSYPLFLPAMVHFIDQTMLPGEAIKGQSLYTIMITVGTVFCSLIGGIIIDKSGVAMLLLVSLVITMCGTLLLWVTIDRIPQEKV